MATDGADEIVFTGGLKIDICRAFGFMGDGVCAIAGSERRLCNFGNIMCSGCEIEFCKTLKQRICQPEKFLNRYSV